MELKTLKDFKNPYPVHLNEYLGLQTTDKISECCIKKEELKKEAIKIVKVDDYYDFIKMFPFKILNAREKELLNDFLKWWCNITKEDLK